MDDGISWQSVVIIVAGFALTAYWLWLENRGD